MRWKGNRVGDRLVSTNRCLESCWDMDSLNRWPRYNPLGNKRIRRVGKLEVRLEQTLSFSLEFSTSLREE
ncbi:hypothetical protein RJT34_30312 [Clitoria ternatea]|uniref:Uncharacterized protein n=1 Tax=Clitoria ternatea TaxID=43366 RepID=A0AAN9I1V3_CLITE